MLPSPGEFRNNTCPWTDVHYSHTPQRFSVSNPWNCSADLEDILLHFWKMLERPRFGTTSGAEGGSPVHLTLGPGEHTGWDASGNILRCWYLGPLLMKLIKPIDDQCMASSVPAKIKSFISTEPLRVSFASVLTCSDDRQGRGRGRICRHGSSAHASISSAHICKSCTKGHTSGQSFTVTELDH